mgnify:CR=1 FL=1
MEQNRISSNLNEVFDLFLTFIEEYSSLFDIKSI